MKNLKGIVAYFEPADEGRLRLVFKDVSSSQSGGWRVDNLFAQVELERDVVERSDFDSNLTKTIGENLLIRLGALNGILK